MLSQSTDILQNLPNAVLCQQNNQNLGDNPEVDNNVQFLWSSPQKLEALVASIDRPISVEYSTKVRQPTTTHCTLSHIRTTASVSFFLLRRGIFKIRNELRIWTIHPDILQILPNAVLYQQNNQNLGDQGIFKIRNELQN